MSLLLPILLLLFQHDHTEIWRPYPSGVGGYYSTMCNDTKMQVTESGHHWNTKLSRQYYER